VKVIQNPYNSTNGQFNENTLGYLLQKGVNVDPFTSPDTK